MTQSTAVHGEKISLLRVLGPGHVWALGVGIVLVGEYMGWNFAVGKGGMIAALIACWVAGLLYTCVAMIDSEVTSTVAAAGGQYAQAKHIVGPLMAFNVGLYLVFAYTMLEAANAITLGYLVQTVGTMAGFSDDQYAEQPDALSRIVAAAEKRSSPFRSSTDGDIAYYLRRAEYIGPCQAPFGTVHVARLFYIRSAPKGSKAPARGHTFIVFLDRDFSIRSHWTVDHTLGHLGVSGSKLLLDDNELIDFAHPPASGHVAVDGSIQPVPLWK